jgi:hypothetical protein
LSGCEFLVSSGLRLPDYFIETQLIRVSNSIYRSSRLLVLDGEDSPLLGNPFEHMRSAIGERYPGPGDEVLDRGGNKNLAGAGEC